MGITRDQLRSIGFRPINVTQTAFHRFGAYASCHQYYDNLSTIPDDFYKVEVRQDPNASDYNASKDWSTCYALDELIKAISEYHYYENWRKINGFDPSWGLTKEPFKW